MISTLILLTYFTAYFEADINSQIQSKCRYENLSEKFIYELSTKKNKEDNRVVITDLYITIINKSNSKVIQTIHRFGEDVTNLFEETFTNSNASRSYLPGFKKNTRVSDEDNEDGDIIVVDFNFDGKEDFAVKKDIGRALMYDFYYQNNENKFVLDTYLSKHHSGMFPKFDFVKKSIIYAGFTGVDGWWKNYYNYNSKSNKWVLVKSETGKFKINQRVNN